MCVEWIGDQEQGFMTPRTMELLVEARAHVELVPVTTRSVEQYKRIIWPAGCVPHYAVVTNGAVLLRDGEIDGAWREASEPSIASYREALLALMPEFADKDKFLRCRMVDDAYMFAYCGHGVSPIDCVCKYKEHSPLNILNSGKKVYFFPPGINKGHAVRRLKALFSPVATVAAGDSAIDVPMLNEADLAIIPTGFQESAIQTPYVRAPEAGLPFSEFVLETVCTSV